MNTFLSTCCTSYFNSLSGNCCWILSIGYSYIDFFLVGCSIFIFPVCFDNCISCFTSGSDDSVLYCCNTGIRSSPCNRICIFAFCCVIVHSSGNQITKFHDSVCNFCCLSLCQGDIRLCYKESFRYNFYNHAGCISFAIVCCPGSVDCSFTIIMSCYNTICIHCCNFLIFFVNAPADIRICYFFTTEGCCVINLSCVALNHF